MVPLQTALDEWNVMLVKMCVCVYVWDGWMGRVTAFRGVSEAENKVSPAVCSKMRECLFLETLLWLWISAACSVVS